MHDVVLTPIGVILTPFVEIAGMPIQAVAARGVRGMIELRPDLVAGLKDLDGMSHLILIYHLHLSSGSALTVTPFMDDREHGIFATRSPRRPNAIGLSTVRLVGIDGNRLDIEDVDMLDGTPLLDIKPYVPALDDRPEVRTGWFADRVSRVHRNASRSALRAAGSGRALEPAWPGRLSPAVGNRTWQGSPDPRAK